MPDLYDVLADRVASWRLAGYPQDRFPAIAEILQFATVGGNENGTGQLRYGRVFFKIVFADDAITAPDVAAVAGFLSDRSA